MFIVVMDKGHITHKHPMAEIEVVSAIHCKAVVVCCQIKDIHAENDSMCGF